MYSSADCKRFTVFNSIITLYVWTPLLKLTTAAISYTILFYFVITVIVLPISTNFLISWKIIYIIVITVLTNTDTIPIRIRTVFCFWVTICLLYTSDAADD